MMKNMINFFVLVSAVSLFAQHSFPVVRYPTWVAEPNETITIEFADIEGNLNNCDIYFSRNPGGADAANYTEKIINAARDYDSYTRVRRISFVQSQNANFKSGINYVIVRDAMKGENSNEVKIIVRHSGQSTIVSPKSGLVNNTTPLFSWTRPGGVPYSHVLLSDESIDISGDSGKISLESVKGISMIWQTITKDNSIRYGEPDPSGIFATAPPPLSPGKTYSWFVFNNYGNNPAYTAAGDVAIPAFFGIINPSAVGRKTPENVFPVSTDKQNPITLNSNDNGAITFRWKNLDNNANIYKVFVYTKAKMGVIEAQVVVWSGEVMAGQFKDSSEAKLSMSAKDILSDNEYSWRVIAMYNDGSGQAGGLSDFKYSAPSGTITVNAYEEILFVDGNGGEHRFEQPLALAEVELDVLSGSLEETVLFFTDNNGWASRVRSAGTHRISIKKEGYESESKIVQIRQGDTENVELYLRRPYSSIYGKITDAAGVPVNLANITAVSDNGDTVRAQSLPDGNYLLNCSYGDWTVTVGRQGFITSQSRRVQLKNAQNKRENFTIEKNSLTLSGTVMNNDGKPVTGAVVKIFSEDGNAEVAALLSTPSDGRFSFFLAAGIYKITAIKTGLAPFENTVAISSNQNMQITLSSGAAMLKGTLYGVSYLANSEGALLENRAALTNAKLEVIDTTGNKDSIIATAATDRVYGTYGVSVAAKPAGFQYKLKFSADGFDGIYGFTDATGGILDGNTYTRDFDINAFASVNGQVFCEQGLSPSGVSVSLIRKSDKYQIAVTKTDGGGKFTFFRIPSGVYDISANGNGQTKDRIEQTLQTITATSDETTVEGGKFRAGILKHDVSFIKIYTKEANATVLWTAKTNPDQTAHDPSVSITVYSPLVKNLSDNKLEYAAAGVRYLARATSSDPDIIACVERPFSFIDDGNAEQKDIIPMPFKYVKPQGAETQTAKLEISKWQSVEVIKAQAYYRRKGETAYGVPVTGVVTADMISFNIELGNKAGSNIEYYFDIETTDGVEGRTVYGNKAYPYARFVAADPNIITRWEVLPTGENKSIALALKGRTEVYVNAYYGANYTPIEKEKLKGRFKFVSDNPNVLKISPDNTSAIITGETAGKAKLIVSLDENGNKDTVNVTVTDREIDTITVVLRSPTEYPDFIKNTENVIFGVEAKDKNAQSVFVTPTWIINPKAAGKIDQKSGLFTPSPDFIGRVYITAQVNSKVRHEFVMGGEKGMLVAHPVMANRSSASNKEDAELEFRAGAADATVIVTLDNPELKNFILHNVEKNSGEKRSIFIISDVFEIRRRFGENFSDTVKVKLKVPEIYHRNLKNGQNDASKLAIAVWDETNLRWEYPRDHSPDETEEIAAGTFGGLIVGKAKYDHEEKTLLLPIDGLLNDLNGIRAAIIGIGLETDASVEVSPNPFSPFVSPINDYLTINKMNGDVKGTCIKITPESSETKFKPSARVAIFTAEGTMVYYTTLNGISPGETYYLFWDGRKQLSRTSTNRIEVESNAALFARGDEMCRNGRYFVNVTIDDGKDKKRYTKEIILFK